ncbi:MAG: hypothetical protein L0J79_05815 [Propionibacterium sp.]|nr:hypothetical protein [Propionibacterium sp.]
MHDLIVSQAALSRSAATINDLARTLRGLRVGELGPLASASAPGIGLEGVLAGVQRSVEELVDSLSSEVQQLGAGVQASADVAFTGDEEVITQIMALTPAEGR